MHMRHDRVVYEPLPCPRPWRARVVISIEELRRLEKGEVYDVLLIGRDDPHGDKVLNPDKTFRFVFEQLQVQLNNIDGGRRTMANPVSTMVWGEAVVYDVPDHIFVPEGALARDGLRYGFQHFLIKRIDPVA